MVLTTAKEEANDFGVKAVGTVTFIISYVKYAKYNIM